MSNIAIATNQSASATTLSFNLTGESGTIGFGSITIPKATITLGTKPTLYIDQQQAQDQGYSEDSNNYYVWYTVHFSSHEVTVVFTSQITLPSTSSMPTEIIYALAAVIAIALVAAILVFMRKRGHSKVKA